MIIERCVDGLTRERWRFELRPAVGGGYAWACAEYERDVRKKKAAKTWARIAYMGTWQSHKAARDTQILKEAPLDTWVVAEVRRIAAAAPVLEAAR